VHARVDPLWRYLLRRSLQRSPHRSIQWHVRETATETACILTHTPPRVYRDGVHPGAQVCPAAGGVETPRTAAGPATSPKSVRTRRGRAAMDVCIDEISARSSTSLYNAHGGYRANVSEMQMAERPRRGEVAWARRIECKSHLASSIGALTLQVAWSSISCV
jgi:hypothetical protein